MPTPIEDQDVLPFDCFIVKVASRCNLNCSYCFIYNKADSRWQLQPPLMSQSVFEKTCDRILEHCVSHAKSRISITLHGGEPLLGGVRQLRAIFSAIQTRLRNNGISVQIGMQSNGALFTEEIGNLMVEYGARIGISLDGPPSINDMFRIDHQGRGSSALLESKLKILAAPRYKSLLTGMLVVVNLSSDPEEVLRYLLQFDPPEIDFLLPYDNWDRRPAGKEDDRNTPYGEWLKRAFNFWYHLNSRTRIRQFSSMMRLMLGGNSLVETVGLNPVTFIVVETNGQIEALDSLKGAFDGATDLGLNVFDHSFDVAARHVAVKSRQSGTQALSGKCRSCSVVQVCGGGYLPTRYSSANGFDNPSIYCRDLEMVIRHIHQKVTADIEKCGDSICE